MSKLYFTEDTVFTHEPVAIVDSRADGCPECGNCSSCCAKDQGSAEFFDCWDLDDGSCHEVCSWMEASAQEFLASFSNGQLDGYEVNRLQAHEFIELDLLTGKWDVWEWVAD